MAAIRFIAELQIFIRSENACPVNPKRTASLPILYLLLAGSLDAIPSLVRHVTSLYVVGRDNPAATANSVSVMPNGACVAIMRSRLMAREAVCVPDRTSPLLDAAKSRLEFVMFVSSE
jgi:hypothetical protein